MGRVSDAKERLMGAVSELIWAGSYGSTTIDQICDKAGVKKGSFYYFFDSKADVALAAIETEWNKIRAELDSLFSPTNPPLERIAKFCDFNYEFQAGIKAKHGSVLGCPMFTLGSEVSTQEDNLRKKVQEILDYKRRYFESAVRDAHAVGLIHAPDAATKAHLLFTYYQGLLTEARIQNDLEILRTAIRGMYDLLGVKTPQPVSA